MNCVVLPKKELYNMCKGESTNLADGTWIFLGCKIVFSHHVIVYVLAMWWQKLIFIELIM